MSQARNGKEASTTFLKEIAVFVLVRPPDGDASTPEMARRDAGPPLARPHRRPGPRLGAAVPVSATGRRRVPGQARS